MFKELLPDMLTKSARLILDFDTVPDDIDSSRDIRSYFEDYRARGLNPRLPSNRQKINNAILHATNCSYLVSGYIENRRHMLSDTSIAREGRTYHLGIDIFTRNLETIYAPCDGEVVEVGKEEGFGTFGNYVVFKPEAFSCYFFLGHLSSDLPAKGNYKAGDSIAKLGDYINNENGGWSRHLHLQLMTDHSYANPPIGYSSEKDLKLNKSKFPDPMSLYPDWVLT